MELPFFIFSLFILTLCSAFFSASETALFSLSTVTVKTYKKNRDEKLRQIARLLSHPRDLLVTILMLNILVNILVQNTASNLFGESMSWAYKVGVPLALTLLFGEIVPKTLAMRNNAWIAYRVSGVIFFLQKFLGPFRVLISFVTSYLYRILFFFLKKEESISTDELQHVLKKSEALGVLQQDEAHLIDGFLQLQEASIRELTRPREDVIFYKTTAPIEELLSLFIEKECSRVPVCDDNLDGIKGIITAHQFFLHRSKIKTASDLTSYLYKPFFVPETMTARSLLRQLRTRQEETALVVDEYGSITGLITEEDLVEVVIGPIIDLRDEKSLFTRAGSDIIIASGKLELSDFANIFGVELNSKQNMVTVGGWLTEQLGDIPKGGTKFIGEGFLFHVLAADPSRVRRIYIRQLSSSLSQDPFKNQNPVD